VQALQSVTVKRKPGGGVSPDTGLSSGFKLMGVGVGGDEPRQRSTSLSRSANATTPPFSPNSISTTPKAMSSSLRSPPLASTPASVKEVASKSPALLQPQVALVGPATAKEPTPKTTVDTNRRSRLDPMYKRIKVRQERPAVPRCETTLADIGAEFNPTLASIVDAWFCEADADVSAAAESTRDATAPTEVRGSAMFDVSIGPLTADYLRSIEAAETSRAKEQQQLDGLGSLRQALVIGVGEYPKDTRIAKDQQPATDAAEVAVLLRDMGYNVVLLSTASTTQSSTASPGQSATDCRSSSSVSDGPSVPKNTPVVPQDKPTREVILREARLMSKRAKQALAQYQLLLKTPGAALTYGPLDPHPQAVPLIMFFGAGFHIRVGHSEWSTTGQRYLLPVDSTLTAAMSTPAEMAALTEAAPLTLDELARATSEAHDPVDSATDVGANIVFADCFAASRLTNTCLTPESNGFFLTGGAKSTGSDLIAEYGVSHRLLGTFYLKRAISGYAARDSRLTLNAVNSYIADKMTPFGVKCDTTASKHYVGEMVIAKVGEMKYTRGEIAQMKGQTHTRPAVITLMVVPLRNQDPRTHHFTTEFERCMSKSLKVKSRDVSSSLRCNGRTLTGRFALFARGATDVSRWATEDTGRRIHERRATAQLSQAHGAAAYRLTILSNIVAGFTTFSTRFATGQFIATVAASTRSNISALLATAFPVGTPKLLSPLSQSANLATSTTDLRSPNRAALVSPNTPPPAPRRGEDPYLGDHIRAQFYLDNFQIHAVGAEVAMSFRCSEYMAYKADRALRIGNTFRGAFVVSNVQVTMLTPEDRRQHDFAAKIQAAYRGWSMRRAYGVAVRLMLAEQRQRRAMKVERKRELRVLQLEAFSGARAAFEKFEAHIRTQRYEIEFDGMDDLRDRAKRAVIRIESVVRERVDIFYEVNHQLEVKGEMFARMTEIEGPRVAFMVFMTRSAKLTEREVFQRRIVANEEHNAWKKIHVASRYWGL
jgi:hypothetical protein